MQSPQVVDWSARETYSIREITEGWQRDRSIYESGAAALGMGTVEFLEGITKPQERRMNDLTTAALMMWYMKGVDIESDGDFGINNSIINIGDMTQPDFDLTPEGKLFWEICNFDFIWSVIRGSETNEDVNRDVYESQNPAYHQNYLNDRDILERLENIVNLLANPDSNVNRDPVYPSTFPGGMLGAFSAGEPWNEYQELMWEQRDNWGPQLDWMDIAGNVRTTNKKEVQRKYRDMSFDEASMMRTGERVRHMIGEVGVSKDKLGLQGHGLSFEATFDYVTNPDFSARDFRWEVERVGVAMKIVLLLQFLNFLIEQARYLDGSDEYGNLENINGEKWLSWRKRPAYKPYDIMLSTPRGITRFELAMLGDMGAGNSMSGVAQLVSALNRTRNSRQLNKGGSLPRYGWVDAIHSQEVYNKFATEGAVLGTNHNTTTDQALFLNKGSASEVWFRRQSRQDAVTRDEENRTVKRDLHAEWGLARPENPLAGGANTHRGESNIIRTDIS